MLDTPSPSNMLEYFQWSTETFHKELFLISLTLFLSEVLVSLSDCPTTHHSMDKRWLATRSLYFRSYLGRFQGNYSSKFADMSL